MINYISTRGSGTPQNFENILLAGLAPDGGLYVPESLPTFSPEDLRSLTGKSYSEIAYAVMYPFVEGCIPSEDFRQMIEETYTAPHFRHSETAPLHKISDEMYVLELFHGPTIAFKDIALQFLGRLFDYVLNKRDEHITIIGATSGDTGSAAIEGCKICDRLDIFMLHPKGRVSDVQRRQMTTIDAPNVFNIALAGDFDDCQGLVKDLFGDQEFRAEMNLSAVNSINWARIMAQIVYYFTASLALGVPDKEISFVVPTGNFGNVFAAHMARKMGLPIKTLAIATNANDILTRFFETGTMRKESTKPSFSPSMDIQISSNFERYLFELLGNNSEDLKSFMNDFKKEGTFSLSSDLLHKAKQDFKAYRATDEETLASIKKIHDDTDYILDPHSAVAMKGALELAQEKSGPVVSLACAHPAKFPDAVEKAIGVRPALPEHLADLFERKEQVTEMPNDAEHLKDFMRAKKV